MGLLKLLNSFLLIILAANSICGQEFSVVMSDDGPLSIGDDLTIHCRVDHFLPGSAVVWWKRQGEELVRIGANNQLDVDVNRYSLAVQQAGKSGLFYFNIRGIAPEDNGEFGCSSDDDEETKYFVNLVVSDPVQSIHLYRMSSAGPDANIVSEFQDGEEFFFHDGEDYFFRCVASGSNPVPTVEITIGYQDGVQYLTDKFERQDTLTTDPLSGELAFRRTNYETSLSSIEPITVGWKANSQEFKCRASVPNMEAPRSIHFKPVMKIPPVIECSSGRKVPIYSPQVTISCNVYADPPLQALRWYWGDNSKAVSLAPGEWHGVYRFSLADGEKPDMKVARLTIDMTFREMYLKYNLVAKNLKGTTYHQFILMR